MTITRLDLLKYEARKNKIPYCEYCTNAYEEIYIATHKIKNILVDSETEKQFGVIETNVCCLHKYYAMRSMKESVELLNKKINKKES